MILICTIDLIVIAGLVGIALTKGFERSLPFFVFVMVLLPPEARIPLPGLFALSAQRVAIITLVLLYVVVGRTENSATAIRSTPLKILLMVHIAWCLISTADSVVPVDSVKKMSFEVVEYYLMYYILVKTAVRVDTIRRMIGAMVFGVFVACLIGSVEAYSGWRVTSLLPYVSHRFGGGPDALDDRFHSTFASPHLFGAAISFAIIEALYLLTLARGTARKIYLWVALLVMFLNIYKIVTRGPWLALAIGLAMLLAIGDRGTKKRIVVFAALSLAVTVVRPGVYHTIKNLYAATLDTGNANNLKGDSFEYRFVLRRVAQQALDKSFTRALWGYGLESFYSLNLTAPFYDNPAYPFESCDSSWIELMVETGYVGLLIIAILLLKPAFLMLRDRGTIPSPQNYLSGILFINMVQYYFMMTNVALYSWGQTAYMLWMWIAIGMTYKNALANEGAAGDAVEAAAAAADFQTEFNWCRLRGA